MSVKSKAAFGLRLKRGSKAANDIYTGADGEMTIDLELGTVRLHDGATPGGVRMMRFDELSSTPSTPSLVAGDYNAGFFGEINGADFITYDALATQIGLTSGTSTNNAESGWLKFALENRTLYVAKKPARHTVAWSDIYHAGAVYGTPGVAGPNPTTTPTEQNAQVVIDGATYNVRLLKGASTDPVDAGSVGFDPAQSYDSEWNRLLYPVHSGTHGDSRNPDDPSIAYAQWAQYSDADLVVRSGDGNGHQTWCQETSTHNTAYRVARGYYGLTTFYSGNHTVSGTNHGWRPVLELVS